MHRTTITVVSASLSIVLAAACSKSSSPGGSGTGGALLGGSGGVSGAGGLAIGGSPATGGTGGSVSAGASGSTIGTGGARGGAGGATIGADGAVGGTVGTGGFSGKGGTEGPGASGADGGIVGTGGGKGGTPGTTTGTGGAAGGTAGTGQGGAQPTGGSAGSTVAVGTCDVPAEAQAEPTAGATVVGDGTPASCTAAAFETAVQKGGAVTFNCGPNQVTITLDHQIKLLNTAGADGLGRRVIDGGNKVVLSGGETTRLLYQDACDTSLGEVAGDCTNSPNPSLTIQNLTLENGLVSDDVGGGAIYLRGGRLKVFYSAFCNNVAPAFPARYAGGAIYAERAYGTVYVVNSYVGGDGCDNRSANGGGLGGSSTSFSILNTQFTHNGAVGWGGNPPRINTPGGGGGGAIYAVGNSIKLTICGSTLSNNDAGDIGGAIYYSADDLLGTVHIDRSIFSQNPGDAPQPSPGHAEKGVFLQTATANITITNSSFN